MSSHTFPEVCFASKEDEVTRRNFAGFWHICKLNANISVNTECGVDQAGDDDADDEVLSADMFEHWQDFVEHREEIWHRNHQHVTTINYLSILSF